MKMVQFIFIFLGMLFLAFPLFTQEQAQEQESSTVATPRSSAEILADLKNTMQSLKDLNDEQSLTLGENELTIQELRERNTKILEDLDKSLEEEAKANETILKQNAKLKLQRQALFILSLILGLLFLSHFVIFILKLKWGVTLPYWLNALL